MWSGGQWEPSQPVIGSFIHYFCFLTGFSCWGGGCNASASVPMLQQEHQPQLHTQRLLARTESPALQPSPQYAGPAIQCKPPYLAVQQLCGGGCSCRKPLCTSPVIHVQPYWTISPPFFGARGEALPALVLPYVGSKPTLRTGLGTPSTTFCCGDRVKLPWDSGILSVSPWNVTGMLWSPNIRFQEAYGLGGLEKTGSTQGWWD